MKSEGWQLVLEQILLPKVIREWRGTGGNYIGRQTSNCDCSYLWRNCDDDVNPRNLDHIGQERKFDYQESKKRFQFLGMDGSHKRSEYGGFRWPQRVKGGRVVAPSWGGRTSSLGLNRRGWAQHCWCCYWLVNVCHSLYKIREGFKYCLAEYIFEEKVLQK